MRWSLPDLLTFLALKKQKKKVGKHYLMVSQACGPAFRVSLRKEESLPHSIDQIPSVRDLPIDGLDVPKG
jgi:hypothetical protein